MEIKTYEIKRVIIGDKELTNEGIFNYHNDLTNTDNFTMAMNHIKAYLHSENITLHTIRISENCPHLLYNNNNTYDTNGKYRYGYASGPIIGTLKLVNVIYLYHEDDTIIGKIDLSETISEV